MTETVCIYQGLFLFMRGSQKSLRTRIKVETVPQLCLESILAVSVLTTFLLLLCMSLPGVVQAQEQIEVSGEISAIIAEEFSVGYEQRSYSLIVGEHTVYQLFFNDEPPVELKTGDYAFIAGEFVQDATWGNGILVSEISVLPIAQSTIASGSARSALLIVVNFLDTSANCSTAAASNLMWNGGQNINGLFQESSFNTLTFPADTNGDSSPDVVAVTLSENMGSSCDYYAWALAADSKAEAAGFTLSDYQHRMYILPSNAPCGWAGLGNLGCGLYCRSWSLYCGTPDVLAHELGHNLGLNHAATDSDNNGASDCEYCDTSGIMGYGGVKWRHFNAPHKADMGWIPAGRIQTATASGSYTVAVTELAPASASPRPPTDFQIIQTAIPGESSAYYSISYRGQHGNYSTELPAAYRNKLSIHRIYSSSTYSYLIGSIGTGESWSDGQVHINNVSTASTYATFTVTTAGDSGSDGSGCSISGTVLKDGTPPRNYRKLRVIVKNRNTNTRVRARVLADGSYAASGCDTGSSRIRVRRLRTKRRSARNISATTLTLSSANTVHFTLGR